MTAAVLAGGLGTRLRPAYDAGPKVLAPVRGRPFLSYLLDWLVDGGIERIVLCTGYMGEAVRAHFGDSHRGREILYARETRPLGTGGALRHALPHLGSDPFLALNGDSYCGARLSRLLERHRRTGARASILVRRVDDSARYGRVRWRSSGEVMAFEEKNGTAGPGWINAGVYVIARDLVAAIPNERAVSLEREVLPNWIGRGLFAAPTTAAFLDVGTPESYAAAAELFAR